MAEVHTVSCPPLVDLLVAELMNAGARAAGPGEFTMRAFLAGKRDLPRAEAVQAVVSAANREELTQALAQLAGGMTRPLDGLRDDLRHLLADVEAGLDFSEEDIQFVDSTQVLNRLAAGLARLTLVQRQLESRADAGHAFRAVLAGAPNAGKSSLFNALVGADAALVSDRPGTTRDYIVKRLELDGVAVELADTAGWQQIDDDIERQAQQFGDEQRRRADLILVCVEAGREIGNDEAGVLRQARPEAILIRTKCDLINRVTGDGINTSAQTGVGIPELREALARAARARTASGLASSQSRCRHHVSAALEALRRAHSAVLFEDPPEVLALEIRNGLDALGALTGAIHTDDLLDRVFSRFCIGK
jgi:tRNA modification GTPase